MTNASQQIDLSSAEVDVIAQALETQRKILLVQASAGGKTAGKRLNAIKSVLALLDAETPAKPAPCRSLTCRVQSLFGMFSAQRGSPL